MIQPTSQREAEETSPGLGVRYLLRQLRDEITLMMRQELALARAELAYKGKKYLRNVIYIAVGGALAYAGLIFVLLAATFGVMVGLAAAGVAANIHSWLAALLVGAAVLLVGYVMLHKGIRTLRRETPMPEKTMQTLEESKAWLRTKTS